MFGTPFLRGIDEVGYLQWKHLLTQAFLSALVVVYYTTSQSFVLSFTKPVHFILFVATFFQMLIVAAACGWISARLDKSVPWHQNLPYRLIWQIGLGVIFISMGAFMVINLLFYLSFGINLRQTEYYSRDFTVFVACIVCINFYHHILYLRSVNKSANTDHAGKALPIASKTLGDELLTTFAVLEHDEQIQAIHIAAFHLEDMGNKPKLVRLVQWNGKLNTLKDHNSLASVKALCPFLFLNVSRDHLVNRYAVQNIHVVGDRKYEVSLSVPNLDTLAISRDTYRQLQSVIDEMGDTGE